MSQIIIQCSHCGKEFTRDANIVKFRLKKGMRSYCSRKCVGKQNCSQLERPPKGKKHPNFASKTQIDEFSPFRQFLRSARSRKKCEITVQDLKEQWDRQQGVCPYTGWILDNKFRSRSVNERKLNLHIRRASLDRIDSKKGYEKNNIQFVALIAQYAKNKFSENDLLEFCNAVANKKPSQSEG